MTDIPPTQPPGWYYAQGDPQGTQRYWDGTGWQGGPQAVPGSESAGLAGSGGRNAAPNGKRFVAFLVDAGIFVAIYIVGFILIAIMSSIADALGALFAVLFFVAYLGYWIYNFIYLQGTTGQTIGKKQQGITLLRSDTFQPVGPLMSFVRGIVQGIFSIPCYLDHWWIFVDEDNRRLSDKVLTFHVYED